jgi:hypothetical protein
LRDTIDIVFVERSEARCGLDFILNNSTTDDKPVIDSALRGVALLDYDNDGYLDIKRPGLLAGNPGRREFSLGGCKMGPGYRAILRLPVP